MESIESMESSQQCNERRCVRRKHRTALLTDKDFVFFWGLLLASPKWRRKSPRAILAHLDRLAEYPTDFATSLVNRAIQLDLPFVVQDNKVEELLADWEYWKRQRGAVRNFIPPTVEEVSAYCREKGYKINPAKFVWYYEKRGWRNSNGEVLTNWKANVYNWNFNKNYNGWD